MITNITINGNCTTTMVSSYIPKGVRYFQPYGWEHLPLRQTLQVIVYSPVTHLPVYYMDLPGNIPDNRTLTLIAKNLEEAGFKDIVFITDRGYSSLANIEDMVRSGRSLLTSCSTSTADIKEKLKKLEDQRMLCQTCASCVDRTFIVNNGQIVCILEMKNVRLINSKVSKLIFIFPQSNMVRSA